MTGPSTISESSARPAADQLEDELTQFALSGAKPRAIIERKAANYIRAYLDTRHLEDWAKQQKKMLAEAAQEYGRRFLLELIQNAYDVHSEDETGRVEVLWDQGEGDHGVLYVANGGRPFSLSNFRSICKLGLSDKIPGTGIGNKGVGFKSVLHVSEWPEVYSAQPGDEAVGTYTGYCFSYARPDDIAALASSEQEREILVNEVSPYFLPIPLAASPPLISDFCRRGFATVVRLPIRNEDSKHVVTAEVQKLRDSSAPLLLFLPRLAHLVVKVSSQDGDAWTADLRRSSVSLPELPGSAGDEFKIVDLAGGGRYFVALAPVPEAEFRDAIQQAVANRQLDQEWENFEGIASIAVAIPMADHSVSGQIYTYLPMDEADAPFPGHVHGPFVTKLARQDIDPAVPVNDLLLNQAALLALRALLALKRTDLSFARTASVDLLTWSGPHVERLRRAADLLNLDLFHADLVPVVPAGRPSGWASLQESYRVGDEGLSLITPERIARDAGAAVVDPALGAARLERLHQFCQAEFSTGLDADAERWGAWVEGIATALRRKGIQVKPWQAFYEDLPRIAALAKNPRALLEKRILIAEDGRLHACGRPARGRARRLRATVYFRPRLDEGIDLPKALSKYLTLLHPSLRWYTREGSTTYSTPARRFLQDAGLVQEYERRSVLNQIGDILAHSKAVDVREAALRFVYSLLKSEDLSEEPAPADLEIWVPVANGWLPARRAVFSRGWRTPLAPQVEELVASSQSLCPDIAEFAGHLLRSPDSWPARIDGLDTWRQFLKWCGVRDGLWPGTGETAYLDVVGSNLSATILGTRVSIPESVLETWSSMVNELSVSNAFYRSSVYRFPIDAWQLPGITHYRDMPQEARKVYARVVCATLGRWPESSLRLSIRRKDYPDKPGVEWPSPLAAFLASADWIPQTRPGARRDEFLVRSEEAWTWNDDDSDQAPTFAALLPKDIRQIHQTEERLETRLRDTGLNFFGTALSARKQLAFLTLLYQRDEVADTFEPSFRKAYERTFEAIAQSPDEDIFIEIGAPTLLVDRAGRSEIFVADERTPGELYVPDTEDRFLTQLIQRTREPLLRIDASVGKVILPLLRRDVPGRINAFSEVVPEILVDGTVFRPDLQDELLVAPERGWISLLVRLVFEWKVSEMVRRSTREDKLLSTLDHVRLRRAANIEVRLSADRSGLKLPAGGTLPVPDEANPTLIVPLDLDLADWDAYDFVAQRLAELLGRTELGAELRVAVAQLAKLQGPLVSAPSDEELAEALEISVDSVERTRAAQRADLSQLKFLLAPLVVYWIESGAESELSAIEQAQSEAELMPVLLSLPEHAPSPEEVLGLCRSADTLLDLVRQLDLDFAHFNRSLVQLGGEYAALRNEQGQAELFAFFVQQNKASIRASVKEVFRGAFRNGAIPPEYEETRRLAVIPPDPAWLVDCWLPDDELMSRQVDGWLQGMGAPIMEEEAGQKYAVDLDYDLRLAREITRALVPLVTAWCHKQAIEIPEPWGSEAPGTETLVARAESLGLFDFGRLTEQEFGAWTKRLNWLPAAMPFTLTAADLGLTDADLAAATDIVDQARRERERALRSLSLDGGDPIDASPANYRTLLSEFQKGISTQSLAKSTAFADVTLPPQRRPRGGAIRGSSSRQPIIRASDTQRNAIGFLGEAFAYEWLKRHYRTVDATCWRSTNANFAFGHTEGDDGLGYDFEVVHRTGTLFFEVKATATDRNEFEMGASEVEVARRCAATDRFRVLFVRDVLDSGARQLFVLPNPFSRRGRGVYRMLGSGLRYGFAP